LPALRQLLPLLAILELLAAPLALPRRDVRHCLFQLLARLALFLVARAQVRDLLVPVGLFLFELLDPGLGVRELFFPLGLFVLQLLLGLALLLSARRERRDLLVLLGLLFLELLNLGVGGPQLLVPVGLLLLELLDLRVRGLQLLVLGGLFLPQLRQHRLRVGKHLVPLLLVALELLLVGLQLSLGALRLRQLIDQLLPLGVGALAVLRGPLLFFGRLLLRVRRGRCRRRLL